MLNFSATDSCEKMQQNIWKSSELHIENSFLFPFPAACALCTWYQALHILASFSPWEQQHEPQFCINEVGLLWEAASLLAF